MAISIAVYTEHNFALQPRRADVSNTLTNKRNGTKNKTRLVRAAVRGEVLGVVVGERVPLEEVVLAGEDVAREGAREDGAQLGNAREDVGVAVACAAARRAGAAGGSGGRGSCETFTNRAEGGSDGGSRHTPMVEFGGGPSAATKAAGTPCGNAADKGKGRALISDESSEDEVQLLPSRRSRPAASRVACSPGPPPTNRELRAPYSTASPDLVTARERVAYYQMIPVPEKTNFTIDDLVGEVGDLENLKQKSLQCQSDVSTIRRYRNPGI
ncbi:hypothetical protein B0H17DRAFT_1145882 [Mycena rosella]|uniref:Uncharacterized protein n=1 Tax=Mycena rosella TaxID=1033263 RepID=A0AAD7CSD2_MYCRO|nr:hypothetical protein B0H17DRAFT_1145882 [Mycena rosella]